MNKIQKKEIKLASKYKAEYTKMLENLAKVNLSKKFAFWEEMTNFVQNLQKKYPGKTKSKENNYFGRYKIFHIVSGSSVPDYADKYDFDGNDSIIKKVDKLYNKFYN